MKVWVCLASGEEKEFQNLAAEIAAPSGLRGGSLAPAGACLEISERFSDGGLSFLNGVGGGTREIRICRAGNGGSMLQFLQRVADAGEFFQRERFAARAAVDSGAVEDVRSLLRREAKGAL